MAKGRPYNDVFEEYLTFGFDPSLIKIAYDNVKGDESRLLDEISKLQDANTSFSQNVQVLAVARSSPPPATWATCRRRR